MADQQQRIVLTFDEGGTKAKLEGINTALDKQQQAAQKTGTSLGGLGKQYDRTAEGAGRSARAMSQLEKEFAKIRTEQFSKQYGQAGQTLRGFGDQMKEVAGIATGVFVAGIGAATAAYLGLNKALEAGQTLNDLERSFQTITETGGYTKVSIDGLREATYGLIDSTTLLTQANTAMTLGLPGDELEDLYQKTIRLARAQGVDAVRAIESITIGIARQSKLYLDNLGIIVDTEKAYEDFAKANNTTAEALTDAQKKAAFYQVTVEALNEKVKTTAEVQLTAAEALTQTETKAKDAFAQFGQGVTKSDELRNSLLELNKAIVSIDWDALGRSIGTLSGDILGGFNAAVQQASQGFTALKNVVANFNPGDLLGKLNPIDFLKVLAGGPQAGQGFASIQDAVRQFNAEVSGSPELIKPYVDEMTRLYDVAGLLPKALKEVGKGTQESGNLTEDAAKKIAGLVEKFKLEGAADQVKRLGDALNDAIKDVDPAAFDAVLPQFEASLRKLKLDELTEKYKDAIGKGITEADIAALADSETQKAADQLREQLSEAVEKSEDAFDKLQRDIEWDALQSELERAIETMDKGAFDVVSKEIEAQFKKVRFDELRKQLGASIGDPQVWDIVNQEWEAQSKEMASDFEKELIEAQKQAFEESVDFFSEILNGVIEGDIEDVLVGMLKRAAVQFGAEMLAQMTGNFSLNAIMKGFQFSSGGGQVPVGPYADPQQYAASLSAANASPFLVNAGYAAGAYVGYEQFRGVKGIAEGQDIGDMDLTTRAALAALTFGFSELFNAVGLGSLENFGIKSTGKSREQQQRDSFRDSLFEQGIISDPDAIGKGGRKAEFALFGGGYGSLSPGTEFQGVNPGAESFVGLGNVLNFASTGQFSGDLSAMFANALAEADSFNAAVLTTRGILEDLGLDAEQAGFAMVEAFYNGEIGLDELNSGINTLVAVANEDLPSLADGIDLFNESLDDPKSQIPALGLLFQEMAQSGIDSAEEMKAFFAENFAPDVAESLSAIVDAGIDTFDELNSLTLGQTQLVINELDAAAKSQLDYTESVRAHGDEAEKAGEKSRKALEREREQIERNTRAYEDARRAKARYFSEGASDNFGTGPNGGA